MYYQHPDEVSVHNGFPNPATDNALQSLDLNQLLVKRPLSTFFVRTTGGKILIVDRSLTARPNDVVLHTEADSLRVSTAHAVSKGSAIWGVVTATITRHRWNT